MPTISLSVKLDISRILTPGHPVSTNARAVDLYSEAPEDSEVNEYFVIDKDGRPCGIVTKRMLASAFGGLYGYSMHSRSSVSDIMSQNFISVDEGSSLTDTASKAMSRSASHVYDAIAVTRDDRYIGQITIKDLLLSLKDAMVEAACDVNPLTKLPGNRMIDSTIEQLLGRDCAWSVAYIDIDNFKAFNDAYGFAAGDQIILDVAECMKSCFPGGTFWAMSEAMTLWQYSAQIMLRSCSGASACRSTRKSSLSTRKRTGKRLHHLQRPLRHRARVPHSDALHRPYVRHAHPPLLHEGVLKAHCQGKEEGQGQ